MELRGGCRQAVRGWGEIGGWGVNLAAVIRLVSVDLLCALTDLHTLEAAAAKAPQARPAGGGAEPRRRQAKADTKTSMCVCVCV